MKNTKGYILIEAIIAISLFALVASGMVLLALNSLSLAEKGSNYSYASDLSQEGLEAIKSIKERAWNNILYTKTALQFNKAWSLAGEGTEEKIGKYTRYLLFEPVYRNSLDNKISTNGTGQLDLNSLFVDSLVLWENANKTLSFSNKTIISNWQSAIWKQDDWSGGGGQSIYNIDNKFNTSLGLDFSGLIKLQQIATSTFESAGWLESSAFGPVDRGEFSIVLWKEYIPSLCSACWLGLQIKTAQDDNGSPGIWTNTWSGPEGDDGDETDFFENNQGGIINPGHNGQKWIKYKLSLKGDGLNSPEFSEIKIFYK